MSLPQTARFSRSCRAAVCLTALTLAGAIVFLAAPVRADDANTTFEYAQGLFDRKFYALAVDKYRAYLQQAPTGAHAATAEFMIGESYYLLKDWRHAVENYERFLAEDAAPDRAIAEDHLGDSEFNLDNFAGAADAFRKAIADTQDPKIGASAGYWLAQSLISQKDYANAARAASAMLAKYPQSTLVPDALLARGVALAALGRNSEAIPAYRELITRFPRSDSTAEGVFRLGDALYATQDYRAAEDAYQRVLTDYPTSTFITEATDAEAWARLKQKNYAGAAPLFDKVAAAAKGEKIGEEAELQAASCYLKLGDAARGQDKLRTLASQNGEYSADAGYILARSLLDEKKYADAETAFESFVQSHPDDSRAPFAYAGLGSAAAALNHYDKAADAYSRAAASLKDRQLKLEVLTGLLWADGKLGKQAEADTVRAEILKDYPESNAAADSQLGAADRAFAAHDYEGALAAYQAYLKIHPHGAESERAAYRAEVCKIKLGRLDDAGKTLSFLVSNSPRSTLIPDGLLALADAMFENKNYTGAVPLYSRIITGYGESAAAPWALYGRASAYVLTGNLDGAYADFSHLAAAYPKDANAPEAVFRTGWIREKQARAAEAATDYKKAIDAYPGGPFTAEAGYRLGTVLNSLKRNEEARAAWSGVVEHFPRSPFASQSIAAEAWAAVDQKKSDEAEALFGKIVADYPNSTEATDAMAELAALKLAGGDLDGAAGLFAQFAAQHPSDPQMDRITYGAALVQYKKGNFEAAAAQFGKVSASNPNSDLRPEALFWSAESFLKAGKFDSALPIYQDYLTRYEASPHTAAAALGAGQCQQALKHWDEAITLYKKAAAIDSAHFGAQASCYTGECQLAMNQPAAALDSLLKVLVLYQGDTAAVNEAQYDIGQVYEAQKDVPKARDAYTKVANSPDAGSFADRARQRLDALKTAG